MNDKNPIRFPGLALKTIVAHTITYFLMGIIASSMFNYAEVFARPYMACWMRQLSDPLVMAGPLIQPIRGLIFALAFYPLRETLFSKKNGWLIMWWVLVALGILSTFGAAPGSVEGMIYTVIPLRDQLSGWVEVVTQAFLLSAILFYWVRNPKKRWLGWSLAAIFVMVVLLMIAGLLVTRNVNP